MRERPGGWSPTGRRRWAVFVLLAGHLVWMALGVAVYYLYGKKHSMVGRRAGDGLALTEEELKATWRAEEDSGWVGPDLGRRPRPDHESDG